MYRLIDRTGRTVAGPFETEEQALLAASQMVESDTFVAVGPKPIKFGAALEEGPLAKFDRFVALTNGDRQADYGDPDDNMIRIARLNHVLRECDDPRMREVLCLLGVKLARLVNNPRHLDSWIDVAGYARVAAMIMQKEFDDA